MDLSQFDTVAIADEGADLHLRNPQNNELLHNEDGSPVTIRLAGSDSKRFRKAQRANTDRRLKGRRNNISAEELETESLEVLVACTISWNGIDLDGQPVPCNGPKIKEVYTRFPWIREQVDSFIGDRANFFKNSQTS